LKKEVLAKFIFQNMIKKAKIEKKIPNRSQRIQLFGLPHPPLCGIRLTLRVNKFVEFYRKSSKFDGFSPHQILKSAILLFTDSKYLKNYIKKLE
jgi:hypothetical protein